VKLKKTAMKKIFLFVCVGFVITSCVSTKKYKALQDNCTSIQDSLRLELAANTKELIGLRERHLKLESESVALRADSASKNRTINNLTLENVELKKLNENLNAKQTKLVQQAALESRKMLEELQAARAILQKREDALDSIKLSLETERKALDKIRKELGIKNDEILIKNKQLADMEELLRRKDSAAVALRTKIQKALVGFEGQGLTIEQRDGKIYVLLDEALLFKVGKSDVSEKGQEALKKLATVLEQNPDINITVEGHTDNTGGEKLNWELSTKRALAISYILLDNSKINGKRITVAGRGQFSPIDNSNTTAGRAKNRRSEIILTPDLQELYNIIQNK
jgi:chemotaxis protein MotB